MLRFSAAGVTAAEGIPLAPLTTFRIGGNARLLAKPNDTFETAECVKAARQLGVEYIALGAGSNILVSDDGYPGLVIATTSLNHIGVEGNFITCGCGVLMPELAEFVADHGFSGMELICDVPGTVGGGVYMNAGCSGVSLGDLITSVEWVTSEGEVVAKPRSEIKFGYRESEYTGTDSIITEITLYLPSAESMDTVRRLMDQVKMERADKFPLGYPNCGSVFKRIGLDAAKPYVQKDGNGAYSAGYYIERAGLKGTQIGGAMISDKHANFIVNTGGASASDVRALIALAGERVLSQFGIELEREVVFLDAQGRH